VLDHFRRWGYLEAAIDPLSTIPSESASRGVIDPLGTIPSESVSEGVSSADDEEVAQARSYYCGTIGIEFMHIADSERREWIQEKMEREREAEDRTRIFRRILAAEVFEQVIQQRYPGTKRFSLEGLAALIPSMDEMLEAAGENGAGEVVIGMSHRGRLNVMVQIIGKAPLEIFTAFEDVDPRSVLGGGDVKYHQGATGVYRTRSEREITVRLVSNSSHLEAVDPVALGRVRAKQMRIGQGGERKVVPFLIHGDAAFAGQGIAAETLNLSTVKGYTVGGTIHLIADNLIGFTADPHELYSSRFPTDVAKRLPIPIIHVNAEDPDAVVYASRMAVEYRTRFQSDVVLDLIGYRRHGHSEVDDPTVTQPLLYKKIMAHDPLWKIYAQRYGLSVTDEEQSIRQFYEAEQSKSLSATTIPRLSVLPEYWSGYVGGPYESATETDTGVPRERLQDITHVLTEAPSGFSMHPKVKQLLDRRKKMGAGTLGVDFGMAELLAFGTLLQEGISVRLSGQDSRRGTFGHRHAVLIDTENEHEHVPLSLFTREGTWCEIN
ncbi:MAG TPA: thiamine pyrophosphate-dependent enzyme, partial [Bacteroidota bacterium]|nr:thiamine pyrophosphate-dependent enzyme [Bacteroidota bacterium]